MTSPDPIPLSLERAVHVWLWLAYFASVESDAQVYLRQPPDYEKAAEHRDAGDAFYERASRVLGREPTGEEWQAAVESFGDPETRL